MSFIVASVKIGSNIALVFNRQNPLYIDNPDI